MNEPHVYSEDGEEWERVFTVPQASVDTKVDPFSKTKFLEKTNKGATIGEMWDRSAELSQQRAEKSGGVDPIKQQHMENYKKVRGGKIHPQHKNLTND